MTLKPQFSLYNWLTYQWDVFCIVAHENILITICVIWTAFIIDRFHNNDGWIDGRSNPTDYPNLQRDGEGVIFIRPLVFISTIWMEESANCRWWMSFKKGKSAVLFVITLIYELSRNWLDHVTKTNTVHPLQFSTKDKGNCSNDIVGRIQFWQRKYCKNGYLCHFMSWFQNSSFSRISVSYFTVTTWNYALLHKFYDCIFQYRVLSRAVYHVLG